MRLRGGKEGREGGEGGEGGREGSDRGNRGRSSGVGSVTAIMAIVAMSTTLFRPKKPHPQTLGDLWTIIHAACYTPTQIIHVHARVFLKVLVGVACRQLSLTREPEVTLKKT